MLKLNVGKARQVIKLPQSIAILHYSGYTECAEYVLYRPLVFIMLTLYTSNTYLTKTPKTPSSDVSGSGSTVTALEGSI